MSQCPSSADLARLRMGLLDDATAAKLRSHLATCAACRSNSDQVGDPTLAVNAEARAPSQRRFPSDDETRGTSPAARMARHLPNIDGFKIHGLVGKGGMGIVYRAVQTRLHRQVALKVLPAIMGTASPDAVTRFRREATAAARLHHTNIIPIYDFGESHDSYYCAMELITGKALDEVIRGLAESNSVDASPAILAHILSDILDPAGNGDADVAVLAGAHDGSMRSSGSSLGRGRSYYDLIARWMADAADALHYAHGEGIIHRDIKPSNLILSVDGRIMVADFGLAREIGDASITTTGSLVGTLRYMSPEQAMAKRVRVDHRTDIYSLGTTLYELLTFQPAFQGDDDKELLGKIIARDPVHPRKLTSSVPHELETICLKSLEKLPDARYQSARALAEDLRRYINDLPIVAKPPGPVTRVVKLVRRHKTVSVSLAVTLVLSVSTAYFVSQNVIQARIQRFNGSVKRAMELGQQDQWQAAENIYLNVLREDETYLRAAGNLAILYKDWYDGIGKTDRSILYKGTALCDRMIDIYPTNARLRNVKGVLLKLLGDLDGAFKSFTEAVGLDQADYPAWANLGLIHLLRGSQRDTEECLRKSVALSNETATAVDPVRNLAAFELYLGRPTALDNIQEALRRDRASPTSYLIAARIYLQLPGQRDFAKALSAATTADTLSGDEEPGNADPRIKRFRALAELRNNHLGRAVRFAEWAIQLGDRPTINHLIIAIAQAELRRFDEADEAMRKAEADWPKELRDRTGLLPNAEKGLLWIDTAEELFQLRDEAREVLGSRDP